MHLIECIHNWFLTHCGDLGYHVISVSQEDSGGVLTSLAVSHALKPEPSSMHITDHDPRLFGFSVTVSKMALSIYYHQDYLEYGFVVVPVNKKFESVRSRIELSDPQLFDVLREGIARADKFIVNLLEEEIETALLKERGVKKKCQVKGKSVRLVG